MPWRRLSRSSRRATAALDVVRVDGLRFRTGPWRGDPTVGYLAPLAPLALRHSTSVARAANTFRSRGVTSVITSALGPLEQAPFLAHGFEPIEELHVLARDLDAGPHGQHLTARSPHCRAGVTVVGRPGRSADTARVLELDGCAFESFWRLDHPALVEALTATSCVRYRVAQVGGTVVGYSITGAQNGGAYLQRLAVDPGHHGLGIGRALVDDAIWWSQRRRARTMLVNTQLHNEAALALYESSGFVPQPTRLAVLRLDLEARPDLSRSPLVHPSDSPPRSWP